MVSRIKDKLNLAGIEAYLPQLKTGKCESPYVVVLDKGQSGQGSRLLGKGIIEILVYSPKNRYKRLGTTKVAVKQALEDEDYLKRTGYEQQVIYLDTIDGFMSSVEYEISKKL